MIAHEELANASVNESVRSFSRSFFSSRPGWAYGAAIFACFLLLIVALQILGGAYGAEFAAYPDEPAHYVTALMLRDYLISPHSGSPLAFAADYYHHYPKVAFGHWPPFFYIVQALWMMLFTVSRTSIRCEMALITALLAFSFYREARRWFGGVLALFAGILIICLPLVQTYAGEEMAESLLTLLCFWSVVWFVRYLDSGRWQDNAWFGVFFAGAVLTKGNGWLLAGVPPIAVLLTRKFSLVKQRSFWIFAIIVGVSCIPWQLMTLRIAERGWTGGTEMSLRYTASALSEYIGLFISICGPALTALMILGVLSSVLVPVFRGPVASSPAVMLALVLAVWSFHSLVPAGVEDRKLIIAVPAMVLFVFEGIRWLASRLPERGVPYAWRLSVICLIAGTVFAAQTFTIPRQVQTGYSDAAKFITTLRRNDARTILVASQSEGEGLLISEVAMLKPHPDAVIIRATKTMAQMDWNAVNYHCLFSTPEQVQRFLRDRRVDLAVLDSFPPMVQYKHYKLLRQALEISPGVRKLAKFRSNSSAFPGEVLIFKIDHPKDQIIAAQ
jgi:hypothetical protein